MTFEERKQWLEANHRSLLERKNRPIEGNGIFERYEHPVLTAEHAPLAWRYDFNKERNPYHRSERNHNDFRSLVIHITHSYKLPSTSTCCTDVQAQG